MCLFHVIHAKERDIIETLEIRFKNKNIADILDMTVEEGCDFLKIYNQLDQN